MVQDEHRVPEPLIRKRYLLIPAIAWTVLITASLLGYIRWTVPRNELTTVVVNYGIFWLFGLIALGLATKWVSRRLQRHRLIEADVARSESIYRQVIENASGVPYRLRYTNRKYDFLGAGIEALVGIPRDDFSFACFKDIVQEIVVLDAEAPSDALELGLAFREGKVDRYRVDLKIRTPQGQEKWLNDCSVPLRDPSTGKVVGALGILQDITERKQAEEQHTLLVTAIEQSAESVFVTDLEGTIEYVNPAFEQITGYSKKEALGRNSRMLWGEESSESLFEDLRESLLRGEVWQGRIRSRKKDDTTYEAEAALSPVRDAAGRIVQFVSVWRDVTHEAELESRLRQSQKMEAIGQLAGGVAHDFNNLLQAIQGHAQLALQTTPPEQSAYEDLNQITKAAEHAASLTRQLLAFSRRQVIQARNLNLNQVIIDLMKMLRRVIGEHLDLELSLGNKLRTVHADPGQIEQVLMNLCVNARDALPHGGRITIETANVLMGKEQCVGHPLAKAGLYVMLAVTDTGIGMTPEVRERIFEPFFTTKEVGQGTGLGLATVYGVVRQHAGLISVTSKPGAGTKFRLYFPTVEGSPSQDKDQEAQQPATPPGGTETLLLAEDDEIVRNLTERILQQAGYTILLAKNGLEAMDLFYTHQARIAMLVLDVVMPQMSGRAVYEKVKKMKPEIPILFTSGHNTEMLETRFITREGLKMLPKPYNPNELLTTVREMLDRAHRKPSRRN